jgi:hypothetical protein
MTVSNQSQLEYFNSFGLVFNDCFFIKRGNNFSCVNFNNVKSIRLIRGREVKINFLIFIAFCVVVCSSFFFREKQILVKYILQTASVPLLITTFLIKKYIYNMIVLTNDFNSVLTKVGVDSKNEAKEIVAKVNNKLKEKEPFLKAI